MAPAAVKSFLLHRFGITNFGVRVMVAVYSVSAANLLSVIAGDQLTVPCLLFRFIAVTGVAPCKALLWYFSNIYSCRSAGRVVNTNSAVQIHCLGVNNYGIDIISSIICWQVS